MASTLPASESRIPTEPSKNATESVPTPAADSKHVVSWDPDAYADAQKWHAIAQAWFRYLEWITLAAIVQVAFVHAREPVTRGVLLLIALATLFIGYQVIQSHIVAVRFERFPFANQPKIRGLLAFVVLALALAASRVIYMEAIRGLRPPETSQSFHQQLSETPPEFSST